MVASCTAPARGLSGGAILRPGFSFSAMTNPLRPNDSSAPAGASLVELYSAFAFQGPALVPRVKRELAACLERDGFASVADAVSYALVCCFHIEVLLTCLERDRFASVADAVCLGEAQCCFRGRVSQPGILPESHPGSPQWLLGS